MRRPGLFAAAILSLTLLMAPGSARAGSLTPRLQAALAAGDESTHTVWVFFRDKGLRGPELSAAVDRRQAALAPRVASRRAKMRQPGQALSGEFDLPLHGPYLDRARAVGATLRRQSRWLDAASFVATARQVRRLAALDCVSRVDMVGRSHRTPVPATGASPLPDKSAGDRWTLDYGANLQAMEQLNVPAVHELGIDGRGVIIAIMDSGFHTGHECLQGVPVLASYDFINDDSQVDNEEGDPENSRDHGTMTMSVAVGSMPGEFVAPAFGASVILCKTEDVSQEVPAEEDNWVAALEYAEMRGADIISSSLSYKNWYTYEDMDGATALTTVAADLAVSMGMVVITSAGNEGDNEWGYITAPADGDGVISVGAVNGAGAATYFTSHGPTADGRIKPDVTALGWDTPVADPDDDGIYTTASGTSFSCPLVSGVAALMLSRAPQLTPLQVREALRQTASRATAPDNIYGWGLVDAQAAVNYFTALFTHTPLPDTEDVAGPYVPAAGITSRMGLDALSTRVWYRLDEGAWQEVPLLPSGAGPAAYQAQIPGQPAGTRVDYYLETSTPQGTWTREPFQAPVEYFTFQVGQDVTPPVLDHDLLGDQARIWWPPTLRCGAADNMAIDRVELRFSLNGGPEQGPFPLTPLAGGAYELSFPLPVEQVAVGDSIRYTLSAFDTAAQPNRTDAGPAGFAVIDARAAVLVLERAPLLPAQIPELLAAQVQDDARSGLKSRLARQDVAMDLTGGRSSASTVSTWLAEDGYLVRVAAAETVTVDHFQRYDLVVYAGGDHLDPLGVDSLRQALRDWVAQGGKLLVESGEIGYDATRTPGHPLFLAEVLHCTAWDTDNGGELVQSAGVTVHPLLSEPETVPLPVAVNYDSYGDQDTMVPAQAAYTVLSPAFRQGDGGIIVHDDNLAPQSAQIVYMAFNIEAVAADAGRALIRNSVAFLLAEEAPPTAGIAGRVRLAGQVDNSGVLVELHDGRSVVTGADGSFSFDQVYEGQASVLATKSGWSVARQDLVLAQGEQVSGLDLLVQPMIHTEYRVYPDVTIPDNSSTGVVGLLTVPESQAGSIADVQVDIYIQHYYIGDLTVMLISPEGTTVVLHNRSGAEGLNIVGNWPYSNEVDGPGSLEDLRGENNAGVWTLFVSDAESPDEGSLVMWGLQFDLPDRVTGVPDQDGLPAVTRLHAAVPNPFNPLTTLSFDLAGPGPVRLDVFDLRGRLVRRLLDQPLPAGVHRVAWDGRDSKGRAAASGTYLYRLRAGDVVQDRKMQLLR